jgi:hypothetical protein
MKQDRKRGIAAPPVSAGDSLTSVVRSILADRPPAPAPQSVPQPIPRALLTQAEPRPIAQPAPRVLSVPALLIKGIRFIDATSQPNEYRTTIFANRSAKSATHGYGSPVRRPWSGWAMRYPEITIAQEGEIVRLSAEERIGSWRIAQRVGCTHATVLKILKDPVNRQRVQARWSYSRRRRCPICGISRGPRSGSSGAGSTRRG